MVEYKCEKCNKIFYHKHNYIYHLKRKTSCNDAVEKLKTLQKNTPLSNPVVCEVYNKKKLIQESNKKIDIQGFTSNLTIFNPTLREPICVYCNKFFTSNSHRNRHMNSSCRVRTRYVDLIETCDKEIENLIVENRFLKNKYLSLFGDKYLFPFGMEKFTNIDTTLIINTIKNPFKGLPELIENFHFNHQEMRYHNIRVKNPKSLHLEIYNGTNWIIETKENVITTLIRTYKDIVDMEVENYTTKLPPNFIKNFNEFSEAIDYYISYIIYDCEITPEQKKQYKPYYQKISTNMDLMLINTFRKDIPQESSN